MVPECLDCGCPGFLLQLTSFLLVSFLFSFTGILLETTPPLPKKKKRKKERDVFRYFFKPGAIGEKFLQALRAADYLFDGQWLIMYSFGVSGRPIRKSCFMYFVWLGIIRHFDRGRKPSYALAGLDMVPQIESDVRLTLPRKLCFLVYSSTSRN